MAELSPIFPMFFNDQGTYASNILAKDVVKQNFKNLLLTSPGERIMIPDFGVGIRNFLFEQNVDRTVNIMLDRVQRQIKKFMPFIEIQEFSPSYEENQLIIVIQYFIIPLNDVDILSVRL
jgi:phage baseplate assembly protein W